MLSITAWMSVNGSRFSILNLEDSWRSWDRLSPLREQISQYDKSLGPDIGISASDFLLPHLANRVGIYLFPNPWKLHYWGIRGERQHHPNEVDYIFLNSNLYWKHYGLLEYLQDEGYFVIDHEDKKITVLRRLKPEPGDRLTAVTAANDYVKSDKDGLRFGPPVMSAPFPYPDGGFERPPFNPGNNVPPSDWQATPSEVDGLVKLNLQPSPKGLAFAARYIYAPIISEEAREVELLIGSDDTLEVWFEGEKVLEHLSPRSAHLGDNHVHLQLNPGVNHLYFRVDNRGGAWRLIADIKPIQSP